MATSSVRGCNPVYSTDIIRINVLPPFQPGSIVAVDTVLCNGRDTRVALDTANLPSGADGSYFIRWQYSLDGSNYADLVSVDSTLADDIYSYDTTYFSDSAYATPNLDTTTYYRAMVYNEYCHLQLPTDSVRIQVFPAFVASNIHVVYDADSVLLATCYGVAPSGFTFVADTTSAAGGSGVYSYRWHTSDRDTLASTSDPYAPDTILYQSATFYLTTSDSLCGSYTSNGITITVNPLPEAPSLGGDIAYLCNTDMPLRYWVAAEENMSYQWSSTSATFQDGIDDSSVVYLTWNRGLDTVSLDLTLTYTTTGCSRTVTFDSIPIDTNATAPDTTDILIKFGGNILVCNDNNPNAHYEWGYTDRATGVDNIYPNSNSRYYQTPDAIDTARRDYFVIVQYGTVPCKTRSYYVPRTDAPAADPTDEPRLTVAPNPSMGDVYYSLDTDIPGSYTVSVFDAVGQLLFSQEASDYVQDVPVLVGSHLRQGIYVVSVATANSVVSQKIIVK